MNSPGTILEFQRMFPTDRACADYLAEVRWPGGFICPYDGWKGEAYRFEKRPVVFRCRQCQRDTSVTADTIMHRTQQGLLPWFWAAYLTTTKTPGMSALQFHRQIGTGSYQTAFAMLHKLRAAMVRPERDSIGDEWTVEVDEAYVGGRTRGEGRGRTHKAIVVGAVEVRPRKQPKTGQRGIIAGRLRLRVVRGRDRESLEEFVTGNVAKKTTVITDGWENYSRLKKLGYAHRPVVIGGDQTMTDAALPMIHLVFSNLKAWLLGTHHGVSRKHLQSYLNEFVFRFNRRFYPMEAFRSALAIGVHVEAPTYRGLFDGDGRHPNLAQDAYWVPMG